MRRIMGKKKSFLIRVRLEQRSSASPDSWWLLLNPIEIVMDGSRHDLIPERIHLAQIPREQPDARYYSFSTKKTDILGKIFIDLDGVKQIIDFFCSPQRREQPSFVSLYYNFIMFAPLLMYATGYGLGHQKRQQKRPQKTQGQQKRQQKTQGLPSWVKPDQQALARELGLDNPVITKAQLLKNYKKLALKYHPDKNAGGEQKFKILANLKQKIQEHDRKRDSQRGDDW